MKRISLFAAIVLHVGVTAPPSIAAGEERPIHGEVVARLSITVSPDEQGSLLVPSPFAVLPGGEGIAIHVPESGGIFLLKGRRIVRHLPLPQDVVRLHDLQATDRHLVAGRRPGKGRNTCLLDIFALDDKTIPERLASSNPHLRCVGEGADHWRVVTQDELIGVYHPGSGSSVPLWRAGDGFLDGSEQMAGQRAGIGLSDGAAWVPNPDGSVSRKERGRSRDVTGALDGFFLDGQPNGDVFLLEPTDVADLPGEGGILLPTVLRVRHWQREAVITELSLVAASSRVEADRLVVQGRPVRVQDGRLYWIYVGYDFLEIRSMEVPVGPSPPEGSAP